LTNTPVPLDLVIRNGTVFDGNGSDPVAADVAISGGRIEACGHIPASECAEIDASGLYVAPGFIDIHSHSDYTLLVDPRAVSALHQGVTLEVVGNCGHGCFPIGDPTLAVRAIYGYTDHVPLTWTSAASYFERLEAARPAVNVISLVPNGQLRLTAIGVADRAARADELRRMTALLEGALSEGAWGLSTGLEYGAEAGASEAELTALCRSIARAGAVYATHTRRRDDGAAEAVAEAIRVAERARVRLQISHLLPRNGAEESGRCIALVDDARGHGLDVAFDMHTRRFGLTNLHAALPGWALALPRDQLVQTLGNAHARTVLKSHTSILSAGGDWSRVVLLDNPVWPEYGRRDLASIARERGQSPLDAVYDLLVAGVDHLHSLMVIIDCYTVDQQRDVFAHPLCLPASDATTLAPDGSLAGSTFHGAYTWAAWFYRFMVRDEGLLSPAEAIHKLTGGPAERLGLTDRGHLRPGAQADLVVFAPDEFGERGTTFAPNQPAQGVVHVLVNGILAVRDGVITGERSGTVIRRAA
jgi:N-acyl-D-amino-acid deacylase